MIYVECNPDKILVKTLGLPRQEIRHAGDKGKVCNKLRNNTNSVGLVDEDPGSNPPSYFEALKHLSNDNQIRLLHDEKNKNYLIVLCPRLEEWVLRVAREREIDISKYGLSNDASELHELLTIKPERIVKLIEDIKGKSEMLKTLVRFLKRKNLD